MIRRQGLTTAVAERLSRVAAHFSILFAAAPILSVFAVVLTVASAVASTGLILVTARLIREITLTGNADHSAVWTLFVATAAVVLAAPVLDALTSVVTARVSAAYLVRVVELVAQTGLTPPTLSTLQDADFAGRLDAVTAASQDWSFSAGIGATWRLLAHRLAGLGAFAIIIGWRWWVPFVLTGAFLLMSRAFGRWIETAFDEVMSVTANDRRRSEYYRQLLLSTRAGQEVRLFGLTDWLLGRYRISWDAAMQGIWLARRRGLGRVHAWSAITAVLLAAVLALLASDVWRGAVDLGSSVAIIQCVLALQSFGMAGDDQTAFGRTTTVAQKLVGLRKSVGLDVLHVVGGPNDQRSAGEGDRAPSPYPLRLDAVSFSYPGRTEPAVRDLSLVVRPGERVAVVGVNGAGKSTLVKLLCGLYTPSSGSVLVAGQSPERATSGQRLSIAAVFQQFNRYPLSLRQNVALGAPWTAFSESDVLGALAEAGAGDPEQSLGAGLETDVGTGFRGAVELSGGQWQRVAVACALAGVRGGAGLLVLDEPTSAFDPRAEVVLLKQLDRLTRGVTTVLVSHRLSSVRWVDRIIVLGPVGSIVEEGTHDGLMREGGQYASLFATQARAYRPELQESSECGPRQR